MFEKLKKRWGVKSSLQVALILVVFSLTGFTVMFLKEPVNKFLHIPEELNWFLRLIIGLIILLPVYQILLLFYGFFFGQFKFFLEFEKKMFRRMFRRGKKKNSDNS
jgi:hypothetical protein